MPTFEEQTDSVSEVNVPNFLIKLWRIVEDEAYQTCVSWDDTGFSFHILDPLTFSREILPLYFKHNNMNSFVRQLNMYGFRKVTPLERSGLSRATSDQEHVEFQHPYFVRDHPELLAQIKRKTASHSTAPARPEQLTTNAATANRGDLVHPSSVKLLDEIKQLRERQLSMDSKLTQMQKENETLWREVGHMRTLHVKQQSVVNKLIHFLISVVQPSSGAKRVGKRQLLAIRPNEFGRFDSEDGPTTSKQLRNNLSSSSTDHLSSFYGTDPSNSQYSRMGNLVQNGGQGTSGQALSFNLEEAKLPRGPLGNIADGLPQVLGNNLNDTGPTISEVTDDSDLGLLSQSNQYIATMSPLSDTSSRQSPVITGQNVTLNPDYAEQTLCPVAGSLPNPSYNGGSAVNGASLRGGTLEQGNNHQGRMLGNEVAVSQRPTSFGVNDLMAAANSGQSRLNLISPGLPPSPGLLERNELDDYVGAVDTDLDLLKDFFGSDQVNLNLDSDSLENLFSLVETAENSNNDASKEENLRQGDPVLNSEHPGNGEFQFGPGANQTLQQGTSARPSKEITLYHKTPYEYASNAPGVAPASTKKMTNIPSAVTPKSDRSLPDNIRLDWNNTMYNDSTGIDDAHSAETESKASSRLNTPDIQLGLMSPNFGNEWSPRNNKKSVGEVKTRKQQAGGQNSKK